MKKLKFSNKNVRLARYVFLCFCLCMRFWSYAYFSYTYKGQTLNFDSENIKKHTCRLSSGRYDNFIGDYVGAHNIKGELIIPAKVMKTYPDSIVEYTVIGIDRYAFYKNKDLTSVVIPPSVIDVSEKAFTDCVALESVEIEKESLLEYIGNSAFNGCSSLKAIEIPNSVKTIYGAAFSGCESLKSVVIGNSVERIDQFAFYGCTSLKSIAIPPSVTSLEFSQVFDDKSLKKVFSNLDFRYYMDPDGVVIKYDPETIGDPKEMVLENGVLYGAGKSVIYYAHIDLEGDFQIPSTVNSIGELAFLGCENLESVIIPPSVTTVGEKAFYNCKGLIKAAYPSTLSNPFYSYGKLINYDPVNKIIEDNYIYSSDKSKIYFAPLYLNGEYVIPSNINGIGEYAFYGCDKIKKLISDKIVPPGIEEHSFGGLYDSTEIYVPYEGACNYLTTGWAQFNKIYFGDANIEAKKYCDGVFNYRLIPGRTASENNLAVLISGDYSGISNLVIPERFTVVENDETKRYYVDAIGYKAFYGRSFSSITFNSRNKTRRIGEYAFANARFVGIKYLPETLESIGKHAFAGNRILMSFTFPPIIKNIEDYVFYNCNLSEIILPPTVEKIGSYAFAENARLSSIIMGHKMQSIGEKAFNGCSAQTVFITTQTPPSAPNNTFSNYSGKLYVQGNQAAIDYYNAYTCWDRFDAILMVEPTGIDMRCSTINGKPGDTFQLEAKLMPENVTLPQIFWRSTNPALVTVDANGLVTINAEKSDSIPQDGSGEMQLSDCKIIAETLYANGPVAECTFTDHTLVSSISLNPTSADGKEGEQIQITATVLPEDATNKVIRWNSSDESVATVDCYGVVSLLKEGTATITASATDESGVAATCNLTVIKPAKLVSSISLDPLSAEGTKGDQIQITATVLPEDATNKVIRWSSSDENIASVDDSGLISLLKKGTAVITASQLMSPACRPIVRL